MQLKSANLGFHISVDAPELTPQKLFFFFKVYLVEIIFILNESRSFRGVGEGPALDLCKSCSFVCSLVIFLA